MNDINPLILIFLLFLHWKFDFDLQSDEMAINKSSSLKWLLIHSLAYSTVAVAFCCLSLWYAIFGWCVLLSSHISIDGITSQMTSRAWASGRRHDFFTIVGMDQFLHGIILILLLAIRP